MYGALLGDMIGAPYEFDRGNKSKGVEMFNDEVAFTDDSVMSIAVAEGIMNAGLDADESTMKAEIIKSMKDWGKRFPHAGYGAKFIWWLRLDNPDPYGSFGNGSAMRVSSVGWLYDSIEKTREVA